MGTVRAVPGGLAGWLGACLLLGGLAVAATAAPAPGATVTAAAPGRYAPPSGAGEPLNERFRGVNWERNGDNFTPGTLLADGLSPSDSYGTAYAKATQILTSLKNNLHVNTVRLGLNEATVAGSWWTNYGAVTRAATDLGLNVILGYWSPSSGTDGSVVPCADGTFRGCYPVPDYTPWWAMWAKVIGTYASYGNVYLEPFNEANGYSDAATGYEGPSPTQLANLDAAWLARYPRFPRGRVILGGSGGDYYLTLGHDPRLDGTLLSYHPYCSFGLELPPIRLSGTAQAAAPVRFPTEAAWTRWIRGQIAGNESRTVITEFGLAEGSTNFNGPRDGSNCVSYVYAVTDYARAHHVGLVAWDYSSTDPWSVATRTGDGTAASPFATHIVNRSFVDRLQWGFGLGRPMTPPASPPPPARPVGELAGRITGEDGQPLAGVCAHVFEASSLTSYAGNNYAPVSYQACSGDDGTYSIPLVLPGHGRYDVQFIDSYARYRPRWYGVTLGPGTTALKGYNHTGTPVSVTAGATTEVDATMTPLPSGITVNPPAAPVAGGTLPVSGTITVTNDNNVPLTGVRVTDSVNDPDARCVVAGGTGATIAASPPYPGAPATATFPFVCTYSRPPARTDETDTATVTWTPNPHVPGDSYSYTQPFSFQG